jgi:hypothetical protein
VAVRRASRTKAAPHTIIGRHRTRANSKQARVLGLLRHVHPLPADGLYLFLEEVSGLRSIPDGLGTAYTLEALAEPFLRSRQLLRVWKTGRHRAKDRSSIIPGAGSPRPRCVPLIDRSVGPVARHRSFDRYPRFRAGARIGRSVLPLDGQTRLSLASVCAARRKATGFAARSTRRPASPSTSRPRAGGSPRPAGSRGGICRINAACSPRANAPSDHLAPDGRLPGTAAPNLDTQEEAR